MTKKWLSQTPNPLKYTIGPCWRPFSYNLRSSYAKKGKIPSNTLVRAKIQFGGGNASRPQKPHSESLLVCLFLYSERGKVKITEQSEALFKQKWWFRTKTSDRVASRLEWAFQRHSVSIPSTLKLACAKISYPVGSNYHSYLDKSLETSCIL